MIKKLGSYFLIIFALHTYGQIEKEVQLEYPSRIGNEVAKSSFHDAKAIYYGKKPANYNGKVIVFNHGLTALNDYWFKDDQGEMYKRAFDAGYLTAFVATTRSQGLWVNGKILADALDKIANKFQVDKLNIAAWSNAGMAIDVAMHLHGKKDLVNKVIAMGTPFTGTVFWDILTMPGFAIILAGSKLLSPPYDFIGPESFYSTTYYCRNIIRPRLDNGGSHGYKFKSIAASRYCNWTDRYVFGAINTTLCTMGPLVKLFQGTNDGITAYNSALRPGGAYLNGRYDGRFRINHFDVARAKYSWDLIHGELSSSRKSSPKNYQKKNTNEEYLAVSDYQIINSLNKYDYVLREKNNNNPLEVFLIHENDKKELKLAKGIHPINVSRSSFKSEMPFELTSFQFKSKDQIIPTLSDTKHHLAVIRQKSNIKAKLLASKENKDDYLVVIENKGDFHNIKANAIITRIADLNGVQTGNELSSVIELQLNEKNQFVISKKNYPKGIYNMLISIEQSGVFKRSINYGFVIEKNNSEFSEVPKLVGAKVYPNPITNASLIKFSEEILQKQMDIKVFTLTGELVKQRKTTVEKNSYGIGADFEDLSNGIYIIQINTAQFHWSKMVYK